jgi:hypothetical protein
MLVVFAQSRKALKPERCEYLLMVYEYPPQLL